MNRNLVLMVCLLFFAYGAYVEFIAFSQGATPELATGKDINGVDPAQYRDELTPLEYHVLFESGTERPYTSDFLNEKRSGMYVTKACGLEVFSSEHKYESGTGWPSFWDVYNESNVVLRDDYSLGVKRIEVVSKCGEHLGHVFADGPEPTGLRWCINGAALEFRPK